MVLTWLPARPVVPVIDNWPPKSLSIYANFDYRAETEPIQAPDDTPAEPADDVVDEPPKPTEPETPKP